MRKFKTLLSDIITFDSLTKSEVEHLVRTKHLTLYTLLPPTSCIVRRIALPGFEAIGHGEVHGIVTLRKFNSIEILNNGKTNVSTVVVRGKQLSKWRKTPFGFLIYPCGSIDGWSPMPKVELQKKSVEAFLNPRVDGGEVKFDGFEVLFDRVFVDIFELYESLPDQFKSKVTLPEPITELDPNEITTVLSSNNALLTPESGLLENCRELLLGAGIVDNGLTRLLYSVCREYPSLTAKQQIKLLVDEIPLSDRKLDSEYILEKDEGMKLAWHHDSGRIKRTAYKTIENYISGIRKIVS